MPLGASAKGAEAGKKSRMPSAAELYAALGKESKLGADVARKIVMALPKVMTSFLKERGTARLHGVCTLTRKDTKAREAQTKVICGKEVMLKAKEAMTTIRIVAQPSLKTSLT